MRSKKPFRVPHIAGPGEGWVLEPFNRVPGCYTCTDAHSFILAAFSNERVEVEFRIRFGLDNDILEDLMGILRRQTL